MLLKLLKSLIFHRPIRNKNRTIDNRKRRTLFWWPQCITRRKPSEKLRATANRPNRRDLLLFGDEGSPVWPRLRRQLRRLGAQRRIRSVCAFRTVGVVTDPTPRGASRVRVRVFYALVRPFRDSELNFVDLPRFLARPVVNRETGFILM